jgi:salicylate hydroxylase
MAVEDGAILATLLGLYQLAQSQSLPHSTLPETLKLYESLQKARTTSLHLGSISNQHLYHLDDGPEQQERDRILKAAKWEEISSRETEPFIWIDVRYQKGVLGRDAIGDAERKWEDMIEKIRKE